LKEKPRIKEIQASEKEVESLLIKDLAVIDPNLEYLGRQIETDSGFLDILAFDREQKSIAIIELKVKEDDGQLFQGIRYYDWVRSRRELIKRSYKKDIDTNADDWLILLAPSFSEGLKKVARYTNPTLSLFEYSVLELPDGERHVICKDVDYGEPYEPREIPTIEGHLNYITNKNVKIACSEAIDSLKNINIEVQPKRGMLSLLLDSDIVGRIRCRRNFFKIRTAFKGKWTDYYNIYTRKDWNSFFRKKIKPFI
jgi:hypothetical protein